MRSEFGDVAADELIEILDEQDVKPWQGQGPHPSHMICATCGRAHGDAWRPRHPFKTQRLAKPYERLAKPYERLAKPYDVKVNPDGSVSATVDLTPEESARLDGARHQRISVGYVPDLIHAMRSDASLLCGSSDRGRGAVNVEAARSTWSEVTCTACLAHR